MHYLTESFIYIEAPPVFNLLGEIPARVGDTSELKLQKIVNYHMLGTKPGP